VATLSKPTIAPPAEASATEAVHSSAQRPQRQGVGRNIRRLFGACMESGQSHEDQAGSAPLPAATRLDGTTPVLQSPTTPTTSQQEPTIGIKIQELELEPGLICKVFDLPGDRDYAALRNYFLSADRNAIFVLFYDVSTDPNASNTGPALTWLRHISTFASNDDDNYKANIVIIPTHGDELKTPISPEDNDFYFRKFMYKFKDFKKFRFLQAPTPALTTTTAASTATTSTQEGVVEAPVAPVVRVKTHMPIVNACEHYLNKDIQEARDHLIRAVRNRIDANPIDMALASKCDAILKVLFEPQQAASLPHVASWSDYLQLLKAHSNTASFSEDDIRVATGVMHEFGHVLFEASVRDTKQPVVVLDVSWFHSEVLCWLTASHNVANKYRKNDWLEFYDKAKLGSVATNDLPSILKDSIRTQSNTSELMEALQFCHLCTCLPDGTYTFPLLLRETELRPDWEPRIGFRHLGLRFLAEDKLLMPEGFFPRLQLILIDRLKQPDARVTVQLTRDAIVIETEFTALCVRISNDNQNIYAHARSKLDKAPLAIELLLVTSQCVSRTCKVFAGLRWTMWYISSNQLLHKGVETKGLSLYSVNRARAEKRELVANEHVAYLLGFQQGGQSTVLFEFLFMLISCSSTDATLAIVVILSFLEPGPARFVDSTECMLLL
jgi:hypothetical protein